MRSHRPAVATLALIPALLMPGCTGGRSCTLVGGFDTVSVTLVGADTGRTYFVEACVADRCAIGRTFPGQPARVAGVDAQGLVTSTIREVRVAVRDTDGAALGRAVRSPRRRRNLGTRTARAATRRCGAPRSPSTCHPRPDGHSPPTRRTTAVGPQNERSSIRFGEQRPFCRGVAARGQASSWTTTGAWSDAPLPLRSSRSMAAPLTRAGEGRRAEDEVDPHAAPLLEGEPR